MSGPTASNSLDVSGAVVAIYTRNTLKRRSNLIQRHIEAWSYAKGKLESVRAQRALKLSSGMTFLSKFTSSEHPTQLYCVKACNTSYHRHRRQMGTSCGTLFSSICHKRKFRKQVCQYRLLVRITVTHYR
jgi:hypothetical protein